MVEEEKKIIKQLEDNINKISIIIERSKYDKFVMFKKQEYNDKNNYLVTNIEFII